jgi:hypothetical protein
MTRRRIDAYPDPMLLARVVRRVPMRYAAGADPAIDRPAYVRAASGIAWVGSEVAVIQDDASFIALVDPDTGLAQAVALPAGPGGRRLFDDSRRNKVDKLDHEALATVTAEDGVVLVALGSGSMRRRESIAIIAGFDTHHVRTQVSTASRFYAALRESALFAGSELNIEGAVYLDGRLRLFGRGNGAIRGDARPVNATCEIEWPALRAHIEDPDHTPPPAPLDVVQYELGSIGDARLAFTDATLGWATDAAARSVLYLAAAEASPDATRDGEVTGSAIGVIEERGGEVAARWTELRERDGSRMPLKAEGIALGRGAPGRLLVVVDGDAHDQPSELLEVELGGPWPALDPHA